MDKKNKKGAIEMSVGTIVTIVLIVTVIILGIVLVKALFEKHNFEIEYNLCYNKTITPLYKLDLYVQEGCPHCENQIEILGPYLDEVGNITDCAVDGEKCVEENITAVPTWKFHDTGKTFGGVQTIENLAEILNESSHKWTCENFSVDAIFNETVKNFSYSVEEAEEIKKQVNVSFKDECLMQGGDYFVSNDTLTCQLSMVAPVINATEINGNWLDKNCDIISLTKENTAYRCYGDFIVREK